MTRGFLASVGGVYIAFAIWCAVSPVQTSESVGFHLVPGAGQSEYLTVYGGLQLALGIVFLRPVFHPRWAATALFVCLVVHASLVLFRTVGFCVFSGIPPLTILFAAIEWVVLVGTLLLLRTTK